jgi:hypothetical protein
VLKRDCGRGTLSLTPTGQTLAFNARQVLELLDGPPARIEPQEQKLFAGCEKAPAAGAAARERTRSRWLMSVLGPRCVGQRSLKTAHAAASLLTRYLKELGRPRPP